MLFQKRSEIRSGHGVDAQILERLVHAVTPFRDSSIGAGAAVITANWDVELLEFNPSTWTQALEGLLNQFVPILNAQQHSASVDIIKPLSESPIGISIVNKELAVGRHIVGLNWGEIGAEHTKMRVFVSELNAPGTGATTDVENVVDRINVQGCNIVGATEGDFPDAMLEIQAINLFVVIRQRIAAVFDGMITTAMGIAVVGDAVGQRSGGGAQQVGRVVVLRRLQGPCMSACCDVRVFAMADIRRPTAVRR